MTFLEEPGTAGEAFRGGAGSTGVLTGFNYHKTADQKIIDNKKVLIFCPFPNEFYGPNNIYGQAKNISIIISHFEAAGLEVTYVQREQANIDVLSTMDDYGFVMIATHGSRKGFSTYTGFVDIPQDTSKWHPAEDVFAKTFRVDQAANISLGYIAPSSIVHYNVTNGIKRVYAGFETRYEF